MQKVKYILIVSVISFLFGLTGCEKTNESSELHGQLIVKAFCNAESTKWFNTDKFVDDQFSFSGGSTQTDAKAFSGKHSCEVNKESEFGLGISFDNIPKGSYAEISVWRFSKNGYGGLHVSSDQVGDIYFLESKPIIIQENGWEKIVINVLIDQEIDRLKVACYNPNDSSVYFDDLSIKIWKSRPINYNMESALSITLADSNYSKLLKYRKKSLAQKVISSDLKKYVKATVHYNGQNIPVKLRFKGDWTDHLKGDKWSFRIKVGDGFSINGLKSFSIQNPKTRGFLKEWFMHQIVENLGLLTTSYDFVPVTLNGQNLGIYAIEEHFDKQLIESRDRREGPILKMDEEGFWEQNLVGMTQNKWDNIPYYEASAILPFKKKRTFKNEGLKAQFLIAKNLMYQYKSNNAPVETLFELDALAAYHALMDLGAVKHGQAWHNQRLYYNPITSRLEPIAYDLYTDDVRPPVRPAILGMMLPDSEDIPQNRFINESIFNQKAFQIRYLQYLNQFSNSQFLDKQLTLIEPELDSLNDLLGEEFSSYSLDIKTFYNNAEKIRRDLPKYSKQVSNSQIDFKRMNEPYDDLSNREQYYSETGLKAYRKSYDGSTSVVECINFHTGDLTLVGYSISPNKNRMLIFNKNIDLERYTIDEQKTTLIQKGKMQRLFFTVSSFPDSVFSKKIVPWEYPNLSNPRTELEKPLITNSNNYTVNGKKVVLSKHVNLREILFIPSGYQLIIKPGTIINLHANGGVLSYSPVVAKGTNSNPITITGLSPLNNGFQMLNQGDLNSVLEYVEFDKLSSFNYKGWSLTGGVTIYKSNVLINHCTFKNNTCEDAVNLVNCSFTMSNCLIENTFSDGFDADFCTGTVDNVVINKAGNDGLDFSGSEITVTNIQIFAPGDKAISGGEGSTVTIENGKIQKAKLGVVSKDRSKVTVSNIEFSFCETVFACFQKKDEYGPASISAAFCKRMESGSVNLIGKGSFIIEDKVKSSNYNLESVDSLYVQ